MQLMYVVLRVALSSVPRLLCLLFGEGGYTDYVKEIGNEEQTST